MKGGITGVRLTSKVSRVSVITSPMNNVINHFQCNLDLYTSNIQFIGTSCILGTFFFFKILGNFEIDFEPSDQLQKKIFCVAGWGHHDMCLPRAPNGDNLSSSFITILHVHMCTPSHQIARICEKSSKKIYPMGHVKKIGHFPILVGGGLQQSWKIPTFF